MTLGCGGKGGSALSEVTVLKVGGSLQGQHTTAVVAAMEAAAAAGQHIVVVHGGGPRITAALAEAGIAAEFVEGQRVTSPSAMTVVARVLAREVNPELVATLVGAGIRAAGLVGSDGLLYAQPIPGLQRVGRVERVDSGAIVAVLDDGLVPVIAPIGRADDAGLCNINADLAASAIAGAVQAKKIIFLTDVPGIYADFAAKQLLQSTTLSALQTLRHEGKFSAGMIPKVDAVMSALAAGVPNAYVVHGADVSAVTWAVLDAPDFASVPLGTRVGRG